jgi:hypothetical protein
MTIEVPYLSDEAIELDTRALLAQYARARGVTVEGRVRPLACAAAIKDMKALLHNA